MAAAAGGITTIVEHPLTIPLPITAQAFAEKPRPRARAGRRRLRPLGRADAAVAPRDPGQWREGARGFKAFMPFSEPEYPNVDDAELLAGNGDRRRASTARARARRERRDDARETTNGCRRRAGTIRSRTTRAAAARRGGGRAPRDLPRTAGGRPAPGRALCRVPSSERPRRRAKAMGSA